MKEISRVLVHWYKENKRTLPWRENQEPYRVWLSEIMLQQTRVDQATPYFLRYMERFPTVFELAAASQHDVLLLWEGLGYYSRARNMQETAKLVVNQFHGQFPKTYNELLTLKGIGPYTAAAISSICFGEQKGVVDGNVIRVGTRFLGIQENANSPKVRKNITEWADELVQHADPGDVNQALMELGATVCTPKNPLCENCPLKSGCVALKMDLTGKIPFKEKKKKVPVKFESAAIFLNESRMVWLEQRTGQAFLGGLWKFPTMEIQPQTTSAEMEKQYLENTPGVTFLFEQEEVKHAYSHFKIHVKPLVFSGDAISESSVGEGKWIPLSEIQNWPLDKVHRRIADALHAILKTV